MSKEEAYAEADKAYAKADKALAKAYAEADKAYAKADKALAKAYAEAVKADKAYEEAVKAYYEAITALREALAEQPAQQEPEFFAHNVEQPDDWSEWVCPDPKGYLMKCCDCGLVHEAEFGVVRYKSETEREDCDMVKDPNLQAVFRMRRSEQWLPSDTAHRAGGLPMEQPAQRTWVGLTEGDLDELACGGLFTNRQNLARAVEAKLRSKNT